MSNLTLNDWLFYLCCSENNQRNIIRCIRENNYTCVGIDVIPASDDKNKKKNKN